MIAGLHAAPLAWRVIHGWSPAGPAHPGSGDGRVTAGPAMGRLRAWRCWA